MCLTKREEKEIAAYEQRYREELLWQEYRKVKSYLGMQTSETLSSAKSSNSPTLQNNVESVVDRDKYFALAAKA